MVGTTTKGSCTFVPAFLKSEQTVVSACCVSKGSHGCYYIRSRYRSDQIRSSSSPAPRSDQIKFSRSLDTGRAPTPPRTTPRRLELPRCSMHKVPRRPFTVRARSLGPHLTAFCLASSIITHHTQTPLCFELTEGRLQTVVKLSTL